jgi:uncharacterized cupin superfamily protein
MSASVAPAAKSVADIVTFHERPLPGPATPIDPAKVLTGAPAEKVEVLYADPTEEFLVGLWECTAGSWRCRFDEEEYVRLIAGEVRLTDLAGGTVLFRPGDSFHVPSGFSGTWENVSDVRKIFVALVRKG